MENLFETNPTETTELDLNGDGFVDTLVTECDFDNDGIFDGIIISSDTDADGIIDLETDIFDTDGNGTLDYSATSMLVDLDFDGNADTIVFAEDVNFDGTLDNIEFLDFNGNGIPDGGTEYDDSSYFFDDGECFSDGYEQFNPDETNMNEVIGSPEDADCWEYQGESGPCAIYAQVMAFEGMTGIDIDPEEMIDVATEQGWYNGSGTAICDMDKILNYLGAETEFGMYGDMDDIRDCLEDGGRVVVAVDGNEIWSADSEMFAPNDPNHAITIIGIDDSGDEPMVIINDSGTPDGHAIMVPESQFMDAWEDSGFSYVEAYA